MKISKIQQVLKPWMMPIAILSGILFHGYISVLSFLTPVLIFAMLFFTFSKLDIRDLRFTPIMWAVLCVQLVGAILVFCLVRLWDSLLAQSLFIVVICPVATAAPVVTGMLGGNIGKVATFSVISNLAVAVLLPLLFPWINPSLGNISFAAEFFSIAYKVVPMIVLPLFSAVFLRIVWPRASGAVSKASSISFYLWSISLIIVVGNSVSFVMAEPSSYLPQMLIMAVGSAVCCALLFFVGKMIGRKVNEPITYGQSLGQKNTVLAIWLALNYLNPLSSVAPAAYVIWQNIFNSYQIYAYSKKKA